VTVAVQLVPCATTTEEGEQATVVVVPLVCVTVKAGDGPLAACVSLTAGAYVAVMVLEAGGLLVVAPLYVTEQVLADDVEDARLQGAPVKVPADAVKATVPVGADWVPVPVSVTVAVQLDVLAVVGPIFGGAQVT